MQNDSVPVWARELLDQLDGELIVGVELLDLPGWQTICALKSPSDLIVVAEPTTELSSCPACGARSSALRRYGKTKPRYVHDVPIRGRRARIYFRLQRYKCTAGKCKTTSPHPLSGIEPRRRATERLVRHIELEAFKINKTFVTVADEVGVSEQLVRNIFTDCAERLEKSRRVEAPFWLAIDEVYIRKKERCVLTAPGERRFVDILFGNDQQTVLKALLQLPNRRKVEVVTMDMCPPYYGVIRRALRHAAIVIDRYHVQEMANRALKAVLRDLRAYKGYAWRRKHMRDPLLLMKRRFQLSKTAKGRNKKSEKEIVQEWLEQVPEVKVAYELKEEFCDIWELRDRREAEERYRSWAKRVEGLLPHPFGSILVSVKRWHREIFNYFEYHDGGHFKLTNAFAESANNVVKTAQRLGKGYRFWVIRAKIIHGGGFVTRRPPHPLDAGRWRASATSTNGRKKKKKTRRTPGAENPNANVERLKRAYEERDRTRNLRLPKPEDSGAWVKRFGWVKRRRDPPDSD